MTIEQISLEYRTLIASMSAALSIFAGIVVVCWPRLVHDTLGQRISQVAGMGKRNLRRTHATSSGQSPPISLRSKPKRLFKDVVERFNLAEPSETSDLVKTLRMAGYRGRGPVITFLATRIIVPPILFSLALLYVIGILQLQHPLAVNIGIAAVAALLGYYAPGIYVQNRITKRQIAIRRAWPDALDLLLICVESGMSIESAFRKVSEQIGSQSTELAEELSLTTAELTYLQDRRKAYENLGERTGLDGVKAVVTSLIQAEKYGTPVGHSLRVLAQENRDMRMSEAEKKAAALPPKLTVPMILFFLPVLFAVILTPAIIQFMNAK
jgi:tight adherence protein C